LDKLDTIINMITSMLMSPTTKQNNWESPTNDRQKE
jgi:hypothetical protein